MPLVLNTNISSLRAQNALGAAQSEAFGAMNRLSTGRRINSASDDAAGLAIATGMRSDMRGIRAAIRNANDGISMIRTAEGALDTAQSIIQRMQELATQSANGTYQHRNRDLMQAELHQLRDEFKRIAATTQYNGIRLLQGTERSLQVGPDSGDRLTLGLPSIDAARMGRSKQGGVSASGTMVALPNDVLSVNGVSISGSDARDDTASTSNAEASAIAKAAAINRHADETGVQAQVNTNVVWGAAMAPDNTHNGDIVINNIVVLSNYTPPADSTQARSMLVAAINQYSGATGVTAEDSEDDTAGIVLRAADGRNIDIDLTGTLTDADAGLREGVHTGGFTLVSQNGGAIDIEQDSSAGVSVTGLPSGDWQAGDVVVVNTPRQAASGATVAPGVLESGMLSINGTLIGTARDSDDRDSREVSGTANDKSASGIATAAAINRASDQTGVTAEVNENVVRSTGGTTAIQADADVGNSGVLYLNGVEIDLTLQKTGEDNRQHAMDAINQKSGQTGVRAIEENGVLTLIAEDGRNISAALATDASGVDTAAFGLTGIADGQAGTDASNEAGRSLVHYASVSLHSAGAINIEPASQGVTGLGELGFQEGSYGEGVDGVLFDDIDISTTKGAGEALVALSNMLDTVSEGRSMLGAMENRLGFTLDSLNNRLINTEAAYSRIMDTDYAAESARLARAQVLQQAAQAMLAQANQQPQQILRLLEASL